jgi:hypothetical protein
VAEFKREVTRDESPRLMTLRVKLLVVGAILGSAGRRTVLRLGLRDRWRERFAALLERIAAAFDPTVAQLANNAEAQSFPAPRPWRPRRRQAAVALRLPLFAGVN